VEAEPLQRYREVFPRPFLTGSVSQSIYQGGLRGKGLVSF
jgi:hypothetical protein